MSKLSQQRDTDAMASKERSVMAGKSSGIRPLVIAGALCMLNIALQLTMAKYGTNVPDLLIILFWLTPLIPFIWWASTHENVSPHRQWLKAKFKSSPALTAIAALIVISIIGISLGSAVYRGWAKLTKPQSPAPSQSDTKSSQSGNAATPTPASSA